MYLGKNREQLNSEDFSDGQEVEEAPKEEIAVFDRADLDDETAAEIEAGEEAETEQLELDAGSEQREAAQTRKQSHRPSRAEERALIVRVKDDEPGAADELIDRLRGFSIDHINKRYRRWPLAYEYKLNCAQLGLIDAAKKFDLSRDTRLTTYAVWWIKARFSEALERDGLGNDKIVKRGRAAKREEKEAADANYIGGNVWISTADVSLDAPAITSDDDGERSNHDVHGDGGTWVEWVENGLDARSRADAIHRTQLVLSWRERYVFRARFIPPQQTYQEIGSKLGFSGERARQLEASALAKLAAEIGRLRGRRTERLFHALGFGARPEQIHVPEYREYFGRLHNRWPRAPLRRLWRAGELTGIRPGPCFSTPRLAWIQHSSSWPRPERVAA